MFTWVEYKQNAKGEWSWHITARNNRILADSGETYKNRKDCVAGFRQVKWSWTFTKRPKNANV